MQIWEAEYKGHLIRVESKILREQLLIDSEPQDESSGLRFRSRLIGRIKHGEGKGEPVMANVGSLWRVECAVTINDVSVTVVRM